MRSRTRPALLAMVAVGAIAGPAVGAAHKPAHPGTYTGTSSSGNAVTITVSSSGKSGVFKYCGQSDFTARFKIAKNHTFGASTGFVGIRGKFHGTSVSGTIDRATGCDGHPATFSATRR